MAATNPAANWFLKAGNQVNGPMSIAELQQKSAAGLIAPETLIRRGANGQWVLAEKIQGLFQSPPTTATVPPVPPPMPSSGPAGDSGNRRRMRRWLLAGVLAAGGVATAVLLAVLLVHHGKNKTPDHTANADIAAPTPTSPRVATANNGNVSDKPTPAESKPAPVADGTDALDLPDLVEKVAPSVVQLNVSGPTGSFTGSGFVIDKQGSIITNYHVIEDATKGTVVFSDKTSAPITGYVGAWPEKDIAVLRVDCAPDKLHPLELATSPPRQGERVAAFGSPLGLSKSVSEGIISAVRQSKELRTVVPPEFNSLLIQTTAPISHGNSGGPLVNMKGMVVGVNTLGLSSIGGENLNFAVSSADVQPVLWGKSKDLLPLPVGGTGPSTAGEVRRLLDRACAHIAAGEFYEAIADCTEAIRLDPKCVKAYYNRGCAYWQKGDHDKAIADYSDAIRLDPNSVQAYYNRGWAYGQQRKYDTAIADFTEAIRLDPKDTRAYVNRAYAYQSKGDYDMAITDCTEAIRLDPKNSGAYYYRGWAYGHKGDYDKAIADLNEAIGLEPENALAYKCRGFAYERKHDYDKAIADYSEAIRLDPKNAGADETARRAKKAQNERARVAAAWGELTLGMGPAGVEMLLGRANDVQTFGFGLMTWKYRYPDQISRYEGTVDFTNGGVSGWREPLKWGDDD